MPDWPDATQHQTQRRQARPDRGFAAARQTLVEIVKWVDAQGLGLEDVHLSRPTLEDVFIELTGKRLRD